MSCRSRKLRRRRKRRIKNKRRRRRTWSTDGNKSTRTRLPGCASRRMWSTKSTYHLINRCETTQKLKFLALLFVPRRAPVDLFETKTLRKNIKLSAFTSRMMATSSFLSGSISLRVSWIRKQNKILHVLREPLAR